MFSRIKNFVLECEQLGYDSVFIDDHLMYGQTPILECWSTLAALASSTNRIRLGSMVTSTAFRTPATLAKAAATIDLISCGRLEFGIGAGIQKEEHEAYGLTFPSPSRRVARMKEAAEVIKALWTSAQATYKGKFFVLDRAICEPKPLQKPYPPITIGGCGEKFTLKVTAQHANRADFGYLPTVEQYQRKLSILESHCKTIGRSYSDIEKSCWPAGQIIASERRQTAKEIARRLKPAGMSKADFEAFTFAGTIDEFEAVLETYKVLGATEFMLFFADLPDLGSLRSVAKILNLK